MNLKTISCVLALVTSTLAAGIDMSDIAVSPRYRYTDTEECRSMFKAKKDTGCVDEYDIGKELGHGFFGTVYRATHKKTGQVVALKCKRRGDDDTLIKEFCYQRNAKHKYVLEVFELTCHKGSPCIAMELADGGDLTGLAKKRKGYQLTEDEAKLYFKQWAIGIAYLHNLGMANRDIKPDNVLLKGNTVKVCDFGITCFSRSKYHKYNCNMNILMGTPGYKPDDASILTSLHPDVRTRDVYALGMSWKELITGAKPFAIAALDTHKVERRCGISRELVDLINQMIKTDYKKRFTMKDVLEHPWMTDGEFKKDRSEEEWERRCKLLYEIKHDKDMYYDTTDPSNYGEARTSASLERSGTKVTELKVKF